MNLWRRFSPKQRVVGLSIFLAVVVVLLALWGRAKFLALEVPSESETQTFALSFTVKEMVGKDLLPAQGFIIVKPSCRDPKQPTSTRLYLTQGGAYCTIQANNSANASIDSASFTSTRQNKFFRLPLTGEKSLSKFWVSKSLNIEATVRTDGTVILTTKPTQVF